MVPRYQLVHSCQVAPPSLPSEWLLFSHQIAGCTAGMHKSTNEVASVCWCWKNLRCCLDPLHLPICSGCSLQAIYQSPLHCLLQVSVILGFLAFYFWGMKEAHTHTFHCWTLVWGPHDKTGSACWCFKRSESQAWIKQFEGLFQAGKAGFVLQANTNQMRRPSLNQIS